MGREMVEESERSFGGHCEEVGRVLWERGQMEKGWRWIRRIDLDR